MSFKLITIDFVGKMPASWVNRMDAGVSFVPNYVEKSLSALDLYFLNLKNEFIGLVGLKDLILEVALFLEPLEVMPCVQWAKIFLFRNHYLVSLKSHERKWGRGTECRWKGKGTVVPDRIRDSRFRVRRMTLIKMTGTGWTGKLTTIHNFNSKRSNFWGHWACTWCTNMLSSKILIYIK